MTSKEDKNVVFLYNSNVRKRKERKKKVAPAFSSHGFI
jgi:hypothetical protein